MGEFLLTMADECHKIADEQEILLPFQLFTILFVGFFPISSSYLEEEEEEEKGS